MQPDVFDPMTAGVVHAPDAVAAAQLYPLVILLVGIGAVLTLILALRVNAFIALLSAALIVSFMAPGPFETKAVRVAEAFGETAGVVGVVIAFAAVIGAMMMKSGAADRIVRAFTSALGEKRAPWVLLGSGYTLSIPVFFDTVFYLLVPLARSYYQRTKKNYLLCLLAICAGGSLTHTLVPPTPGPLMVADRLGIDVGVMMVAGVLIGIVPAIVGLSFARFLDARVPVLIPDATTDATSDEGAAVAEPRLPSLLASLTPVVLPVLLIGSKTIITELPMTKDSAEALLPYAKVWGDANLALLLAMVVSVLVYWKTQRPRRAEITQTVEEALSSGGLIILITSAGGAFGAMLREAGIASAIQVLFGDITAAGIGILCLAFGICAIIKSAQGSTTTALIVTSGIMASLLPEISTRALGFHPVYLGTAIGGGGLVATWMNDSGFWIVSRMGGLTETQALKTLTTTTALIGTITLVMSILGALLVPLT